MYRHTKLQNGISLITVPVKGTRATTVLAMFPIGSRYETIKLSGAAHFVEHMLFKGTPNRPTAHDISRQLEAAGAEYNAFTSKDYTGYYVKIDASKQELAFDLLSDMIYNSKIEADEVEKEKGAIVEELRMHKDNPTMAVDTLFDATLFGDHPLGWDIGGTSDTVRGISREELWQFYQEHYSPKNMVLVVAGQIDKKLKKYINYFDQKKAPKIAHAPAFYKTQFRGFNFAGKNLPLADRVKVEVRKADQAHLMLGFPGLPNQHKDRFIVSVLLTILGSGMSSRLFVEVREKRGLAYMVHAGYNNFRDTGSIYIQAGLDPARMHEAIKVIIAECVRLKLEPVTKQELKDAKSQITGAMALNLENSRSQAEWYAKYFLFGRDIETPAEVARRINMVTIDDVQRVASDLFAIAKLRVSLIGSIPKDKILKMLNK